MRDLQALAGEQGIDVREMEQSAISMALGGYVEEAIELLGALNPERSDARLHFVTGLLLEADGREVEALDHFLKVWNEPEDPAELADGGEWGSTRVASVSMLLDMQRYQLSQEPGILQQVPVAGSLAQAKAQIPSRLMRLAMRADGDVWEKLCVALPVLQSGTLAQWREISEFAEQGSSAHSAGWWSFVGQFPENPLGLEVLFETQQYAGATEEQKAELLRRDPPVPLKLALSLRLTREVTPETIAWLEKVEPTAWQEARVFQMVVSLMERLLIQLERDEKPAPELAGQLEQMLAIVEKSGLPPDKRAKLQFIRTRQALAAGQVDAFLAGVKQALEAVDTPEADQSVHYRFTSLPSNGVEGVAHPLMNWRKRKGDAAADALIERLPSPLLRCLAVQADREDQNACRIRALKEIAALPADAPRDLRRDLARLSWRFSDPESDGSEEGMKQLKLAAADDSDPRLALEAIFFLRAEWGEDEADHWSPEHLQRMEGLLKRLIASDESDRRYAEAMGRAFGYRRSAAAPAVTRWGSVSGSYYGSSGGMRYTGQESARIVALKDRPMAVREAADLLENMSRGTMGRKDTLMQPVREFKNAGLLDEALARIQLPENAGLIRRVSMRVLMDAAERPEAARGIIAGIREQRPWETHWLLDLAFRSDDREECFRLLDEAAARRDFSKLMVARSFDPNSSAGLDGPKLELLADWAERSRANRAWLGPAAVVIGNRIAGAKDVTGVYRRYCKLALEDPQTAESAFGSLYQTSREKEPELVEDAARQTMLSGAYWTTADNRPMLGIGRGARRQAPAAIEHLVMIAAKKGDDAVFPADFRGKLKAVDPGLESWLGSLLSAKRVMDLPGILQDRTSTSNRAGAEWAKHEAAMLRAIQLPGRDDFLVKVFKEQKQQAVSGNVVHVIRESLAVAVKEKSLEKRLLDLLEASAGPRKGWEGTQDPKLSNTCGLLLQAAAKGDSGTLVGTVKAFATWRVAGYQQTEVSQSLGSLWRQELAGPHIKKWDELPGTNLRDALHFGYWQSDYDEGGKVRKVKFRWVLPQAVQAAQGGDNAIAAEVAGNPRASFIDLMRAAAVTSNRSFDKRLIKLAEPELEKLPAEQREGVIDALVASLEREDMAGLSRSATARLSKRLEREKASRVRGVRDALKQMKSSRGIRGDEDHTCGDLVGRISSDDLQLAAEIEEYWLSLKPPHNAEAFAAGVLGNASGAMEVCARLAYLDKFWRDEMPSWKPNVNWGDPFSSAWQRIGAEAVFTPEVWDRIAALSSRMQVRMLLAGNQYFRVGHDQSQSPKLSPAAKKSELLRHAHAWSLVRARLASNSSARADGALLLSYSRSLKAAGAPQEPLAEFLGDGFRYLPRLDNAESVMKETPELLAGIQVLPEQAARSFVSGVSSLWSNKREEWRRMSPALPNADPGIDPPVYPAATAALLKFVLPKMPAARRNEVMGGFRMTSIVLDTGDAELLDRWIDAGGRGVRGDPSLVLSLLRTGKVEQAVRLAPISGGRPYNVAFTREIEQLVKKFDELGSPQAFALKVTFSLPPDSGGGDAPEEPWEARQKRLAGEFELKAAALPVRERMNLSLLLGLPRMAALGPMPLFDEFAGETYAREFAEQLRGKIEKNSNDPLGVLHVAAVCSRFHAGDHAAMERLADLLKETLENGNVAWEMTQSWLPLIQCTFWRHADRHDAVLPEPSAKAILKMAVVLSSFQRAEWRGEAASMIRMASRTPEALAAAVEATKLQGVEPGRRFYLNSSIDREAAIRSMIRVGILHPCASQELLKNSLSQGVAIAFKNSFLDLLAEPKVRTRLQPSNFLEWVARARGVSPEALAFAKTYAEEKKADFNDEQREKWEAILANLQNPRPIIRDFRHAPHPREQANPNR
jgi:hypothetical protein